MMVGLATRRFIIAVCLALAMACIGAMFVMLALNHKKTALSVNETALAERQSVASRLSQAQQDEPAIRRSLAHFDALRKRGVVGSERRLDWSEYISRVKAERRIERLEYDLAPQRVIGNADAQVSLRASTMNLRAQLLHEGDLLRMVEDLRNTGSARVLPRRCVLERGNAGDNGTNPALSAICELDWITLRLQTPGTR